MAAGRPAGSLDKNKIFLLNRLQDMYGEDFHPIMNMAKNAVVLQEIADKHNEGMVSIGEDDNGSTEMISATSSANAALAAWNMIAPYTEPKLRSVEVEVGNLGDEAFKHQEIVFNPIGPDDKD